MSDLTRESHGLSSITEQIGQRFSTLRDLLINGPSLLGIDLMERVQMELTKRRFSKEQLGDSPVTCIHITAPFAAGKSTVAEGLVERLLSEGGTLLVTESVVDNKALERSVDKGPLESIALDAAQTHFLRRVWGDIHNAALKLSRNGGGAVVIDQSPTGHRIIQGQKAKHDGLSSATLEYLEKQHEYFNGVFKGNRVRHINVILIADPQDLARRVELRGRPWEQGNPIYDVQRQTELQNSMISALLHHEINADRPYHRLSDEIGPQGVNKYVDENIIVINTSAPGMSPEGVIATAACFVREVLG